MGRAPGNIQGNFTTLWWHRGYQPVRCHRWKQSWHHNDSRISISYRHSKLLRWTVKYTATSTNGSTWLLLRWLRCSLRGGVVYYYRKGPLLFDAMTPSPVVTWCNRVCLRHHQSRALFVVCNSPVTEGPIKIGPRMRSFDFFVCCYLGQADKLIAELPAETPRP